MSIANQQTLAESGDENRPPILKKGSYVPWASRVLRFLDNKRGEGELMRNSIDNGPYKRKVITDLNDDTKKILEPIHKLSQQNQNQYYADIKVMNYIIQGIPNDIYNFVDACKDAKTMWNKIKRLLQGTNISKQERNSRLMNEFDKFVAEDDESLTSVYERFSTLTNVIDQNKVTPREIFINTKFLNSLQPEWSKYVTLCRQKYIIKEQHFDVLYNYMSQFGPHVNASKAKKVARNHDSFALVANSQANRRRCPRRQAFNCIDVIGKSYHLTPTNNHLCTSSNTRNQVVIQDSRMDIQSKNVSYECSEGSKNRVNSEKDKCKGHNARVCLKPRVSDAKYFREQMLLATKDEARVHLDEEENDFMLDNSYRDNTLEELNATVIMMTCIQPTNDKSDGEPTKCIEFISEVNASQIDIVETRRGGGVNNFGYSNNNDRILNEGLLDLRKVEGCMVRDGFCGGERDGKELVVEGEVGVFLLGGGDGGRLYFVSKAQEWPFRVF
ncbi:hypothetical protein Tco_0059356 [Tanacetum coccineum]